LSAATPVEVFNRPGLSAVQYRSSTHALLKRTMLARLSASEHPALQPLRARSDDDFAVALLDSWAVALDILTFYQERIANESYLRTATERRSLLEQARLIGYEPRPGVAASTYLAFTVDDPAPSPTPGLAVPATATVPSEVIIEKGTKVQSIPGPGEQAQMFETIEPIVAHFSWNAITPRLTQPHPLNNDLQSVTIPGLSSFVKPGDALLVVAGDALEDRSVKRVLRIGTDLKRQITQCDLVPAPKPVPLPPSKTIAGTFIKGFPILDNQLVISGLVAGTSWNQNVLLGMATTFKWSPVALEATINIPSPQPLPLTQGVFAFRERAALFGHNAPKWDSLPASQRFGEKVTDKDDKVQTVEPVYPLSWEGRTLSQEQATGYPPYVYLDRLYSSIVKGSWIVLESPAARDSYQVLETAELSRADFTLSGKITRLTVDRSDQFDQFILRETTVYAAGEALELAPVPIVDVIQGSSIILSGAYLGLQVGRTVVVTGERDDLRGVTVSEAMTLADVTLDEGFTTLTFEIGLLYPYVRSTVTLNANVAQATHGETKSEVLGGGDASQAFQQLTLRQPPLTYTSAPTPSGGVSTLEIRVNNHLYQEVPTLYGHGPTERIYITRTDDDGKTTVQFGNGETGARLPTGQNNILALYRQGIGSAGLVRARQLGLLMTRPLGVREVTNPLDATGAADPESGDDIRQNAALTLRTLDRIVSLQDYEDFARAFSGITKALATWTWNGQQQGVLITVAGPDGDVVAEGTMLCDNLVNAIRSFGDPFIPLSVATYRPAFFKVAAKVKIASGYTQEVVLQAVEDRLRNAFSFAARNFGQPVVLSEVIAEMQDVAGVEALTVTQLYRLDDDPTTPLPLQLIADPPRTAITQAALGAELLTLDPAPLADIGAMS
jgi:predicted phage baseplate assembly protein